MSTDTDSGRVRLHLQRADFMLDVDLAVPARGVLALFGPSGSGKDTVLRCGAGLEREEEDVQRSSLGLVLCLLPGLDRTCLISAWATSANEPTRRALARALAAPFEAVGVRAALEELQRDPSAEVRRLARAAAASREASLA